MTMEKSQYICEHHEESSNNVREGDDDITRDIENVVILECKICGYWKEYDTERNEVR